MQDGSKFIYGLLDKPERERDQFYDEFMRALEDGKGREEELARRLGRKRRREENLGGSDREGEEHACGEPGALCPRGIGLREVPAVIPDGVRFSKRIREDVLPWFNPGGSSVTESMPVETLTLLKDRSELPAKHMAVSQSQSGEIFSKGKQSAYTRCSPNCEENVGQWKR